MSVHTIQAGGNDTQRPKSIEAIKLGMAVDTMEQVALLAMAMHSLVIEVIDGVAADVSSSDEAKLISIKHLAAQVAFNADQCTYEVDGIGEAGDEDSWMHSPRYMQLRQALAAAQEVTA